MKLLGNAHMTSSLIFTLYLFLSMNRWKREDFGFNLQAELLIAKNYSFYC